MTGVNDGSNTVTQQICVYINENPNEKGPVFISTPDFAAPSNSLKIGEILAIDPEGDFVQFSTSDNKLRIEPLPNPFSEAYKAALKYNPDIDYQSLGAFTSMITASDGLNETNQSISITSQNLPPLISNNLIDLDENIVEIPLNKLSITDSEGDDISVTIKPNFVYGIDTMLGNNELLPGYATDYEEVESYTTLGNLDGSPYELTSDFFANNVKIISDIIIADGVKFTAYNYVWSEETSSVNFPEITIGSGRFEATSANVISSGFAAAIDTNFNSGITTVGTKNVDLGVTFTNGLAKSEINKGSGTILYIDNRATIKRNSRQKEDIKIILEF